MRYSIGSPRRDHADEVAELAASVASMASNAAAETTNARRSRRAPADFAVTISAECTAEISVYAISSGNVIH